MNEIIDSKVNQARLLLPEERLAGPTIYPTAWKDGECKHYREKRLVQKAWGFTHLYDIVPQRDKAEARYCVRSSFSGGNGPYYRVHKGENMIYPKNRTKLWTSCPSSATPKASVSTTTSRIGTSDNCEVTKSGLTPVYADKYYLKSE